MIANVPWLLKYTACRLEISDFVGGETNQTTVIKKKKKTSQTERWPMRWFARDAFASMALGMITPWGQGSMLPFGAELSSKLRSKPYIYTQLWEPVEQLL